MAARDFHKVQDQSDSSDRNANETLISDALFCKKVQVGAHPTIGSNINVRRLSPSMRKQMVTVISHSDVLAESRINKWFSFCLVRIMVLCDFRKVEIDQGSIPRRGSNLNSKSVSNLLGNQQRSKRLGSLFSRQINDQISALIKQRCWL